MPSSSLLLFVAAALLIILRATKPRRQQHLVISYLCVQKEVRIPHHYTEPLLNARLSRFSFFESVNARVDSKNFRHIVERSRERGRDINERRRLYCEREGTLHLFLLLLLVSARIDDSTFLFLSKLRRSSPSELAASFECKRLRGKRQGDDDIMDKYFLFPPCRDSLVFFCQRPQEQL